MNCPACGYYNPGGQQHCFHCGLPLPAGASGDAFCAVHAGVKATGACSRCGTFGCATCLTQRGADWLCPKCSARADVLPWDERATIGLWRAWWRTAVLLLSRPSALATVEPDAPIGSSLVYALLSILVGFVPTVALYSLLIVPAALLGARSDASLDKAFGGAGMVAVPVIVISYVVMLLAMQLAGVLIGAAFDHLGLMLVGAQPKSYTVTARAHALGMSPYVLGLVPVCGLYVFLIWGIVLRIIANMHLHRTTAGKATAAVLLPVVVLCGGGLALYVAFIALAVGFGR
ncbi:MAG: hypothetical protein ACOZQL_33900 [Myxococcota bacterium]